MGIFGRCKKVQWYNWRPHFKETSKFQQGICFKTRYVGNTATQDQIFIQSFQEDLRPPLVFTWWSTKKMTFDPSGRKTGFYIVSFKNKISFARLCFGRLLIELGTVDVSFRLNHSTHSNCRLGPLPPQHYHHHHHYSANVNLICDNDQRPTTNDSSLILAFVKGRSKNRVFRTKSLIGDPPSWAEPACLWGTK